MIDALAGEPRLIIEAKLKPLAGSSFQPTGFPDLGAAMFERPDGSNTTVPSLLVESVQSMINHLEALGWDAPGERPRSMLAALPYLEVRASDGNDFLTSSRLEPHRLAAAYVRDGTIEGTNGAEWITERLQLTKGRPLDWPTIYRAIFELDPLCLLHGVFFSDGRWHGNPKVRRAVTATIEAHGVTPVVSGGLKRDDVQVTAGKSGSGRTSTEGYGFILFGRTEYAAEEIMLTAVVDLEQIRGYGLEPERTALLTTVALWEISQLLSGPLRLRTACDLGLVGAPAVKRPAGAYELPLPAALAEALESSSATFEAPGARLVTWSEPKSAAKRS